MAAFSRDVLEGAAAEREVRLTTHGRKTGKAHRVVVWIATDGKHLYIRSGAGMKRDWPQNLVAGGGAELAIGGLKVRVRQRHVDEPSEAREVSSLYRAKYGGQVKPSEPGGPLTAGETATFELLPAD